MDGWRYEGWVCVFIQFVGVKCCCVLSVPTVPTSWRREEEGREEKRIEEKRRSELSVMPIRDHATNCPCRNQEITNALRNRAHAICAVVERRLWIYGR